ncbi:MAG: glycine cleavage system protein H [Deltaproteobacteria bacterium]|nr:glycine cleavage system protein H [Deltaproteobacteria bacterium]MBM4324692.1 glycine cleavage system protein H [Deltaproteobacteria bacterium]
MEGFSYVDIFATKHIEYLLVIGFLLFFIPFWKLLNRPAKAILEVAEKVVPTISEWFRLPEGRYYHLGHSWAVPAGNQQTVKVGIDDFAQKLVGKISGVEIPAVGSALRQGDKGWSLKVDSKAMNMLSPVGGKVVAINEEVLRSPNVLNRNPYDSWLMEIEAPKFSVEKRQLLSGGLARRWMEEVKESLMSRMNYNLGLVYQDGGELVDGMARHLDREKWDEIVKNYFLVAEG